MLTSTAMLLGLLALLFASHRIQMRLDRGSSIWMNSYTWFSMMWLFQFAMLSLPLFRYETTTAGFTLIYIMLAQVAFVAGATIAMASVPSDGVVQFKGLGTDRWWLIGLFAVSIGAELAIIGNGAFSQTVNFSDRFTQEGYESARTVQLMKGEFDTSFLGALFGPILALASLGYVATGVYAFHRGLGDRRWARQLGLETLLVLAIIGLYTFDALVLAGGRSGVVYVIAAYVGPYAIGLGLKKRIEPRVRRFWTPARSAVVIGATVGLFVASAWFQQFRGNDRDPRTSMWNVEAAEPHPIFASSVERSYFMGYVFLQLGYLTSSSNIMDLYMRIPHHPGPFLGRYNFPMIYRVVGRFLPGYDPDFWSSDREKLFKPLVDRGRLGNVWASLIRDFVADFGKVGALLALGLFGWIVQRTTDSFRRNPSAYKAVLLSFLRLICFWSALNSLLFVPQIQWALTAIAIIVLFKLGVKRAPVAIRRQFGARSSAT